MTKFGSSRGFHTLAYARGYQEDHSLDARGALVEADLAVTLAEAIPEARAHLPIFLIRRARVRMALLQADAAQADAARALALHREDIGPEILTSWSGRAYL